MSRKDEHDPNEYLNQGDFNQSWTQPSTILLPYYGMNLTTFDGFFTILGLMYIKNLFKVVALLLISLG